MIAQLNNPAHIAMTDFDGDGVKDFFVGDLGEFLPADHPAAPSSGCAAQKTASIELALRAGLEWPTWKPADFNGDGTLDVAVAAFGWRKVGNITVLENHTTDYTSPSFVARVVDPRPGAIHAAPVDMNKDGRLDLVGLLAQQFETVVAYLNTGSKDTAFTPQVIYTAPHPNWGSSGIQVVDLDGDGDLDVLLTHGDTFDDTIVKPYHGIQWLENRGATRSPITARRPARRQRRQGRPTSTATATSTSSPARSWRRVWTSTSRRWRRWCGWNRSGPAFSSGARSRWARRAMRPSTSPTSISTATSTSSSASSRSGQADGVGGDLGEPAK